MQDLVNVGKSGRQYHRRMPAPVILATDSDADALRDIERRCATATAGTTASSAPDRRTRRCALLEQLAAEHEDVALVLAGQSLDGMTGSDLLDGRAPSPSARPARLLIAWGDWGVPATGNAIYDSISNGRIDHYVLRPSPAPDELFHHAISGWLLEWAESQRVSPYTINIVGESWSGRAYELRELLGSCAMPHAFSLADSHDGRVLVDPGRRRGRVPAGHLPGRDGPARSHERGDRGGRGLAGQPGEHRVRPRDRRRGSGRPVRRGLRRVRGFQHPGRRPGRHRRPGDLELPDPQLPRLRARREWPSARPPGVRAGVGLRRQLRLPAARHRAPA